jgi:hypothetical protein
MTEFEGDLEKYHRYIIYLMGTSNYDLPCSLPSPLCVLKRRLQDIECDDDASELYETYVSFLNIPKNSVPNWWETSSVYTF